MTQGRGPTLRLAQEGGVIVLSILIAFGVDAWWDGRAESERVSQHFAQLSLQLESNVVIIAETRAEATSSRDAADLLVDVVGPQGGVLSGDSLGYLIDQVFRINPGTIALSAVEAILSDGSLGASSSAGFQQTLIDYRNLAEGLGREVRLFQESRNQLINYLIEMGASISVIVGGSHGSNSEFPVPTEVLLGDLEFESRVYKSGLLAGRVREAVRRLETASRSLLELLDGGSASRE